MILKSISYEVPSDLFLKYMISVDKDHTILQNNEMIWFTKHYLEFILIYLMCQRLAKNFLHGNF